jgi:UDP-N-acetyl-D-glucosamine dehydrogenase
MPLNIVNPPLPLLERIRDQSAIVSVIGLGYVGLPLAIATARAGFITMGFDTDPTKPQLIHSGRSYIDAVGGEDLRDLVANGYLKASTDFSMLPSADIILICVPTPLTSRREPDLSYIEKTARTISNYLHPGQLIVLESTTWPGTTEEVIKPILEESTGLRSGKDFFLGFSPEREDPGNKVFKTINIPKVVSGHGPDAVTLIRSFYASIVEQVVTVSSTSTAEAVKLTENIFRAVNVALVNELKIIYDAMGIDIWEVIEAAKTKPFGYMPFYPGPGLGGHCIPIDPFYLTSKAREYGLATRFIELAGEINLSMPRYVIGKLEEALDRYQSVPLGNARIMLVGLAYKKNISDIRESPAFKLIELLEGRGTKVDYVDPHVPEIPLTREYPELVGRRSVDWKSVDFSEYDAVLICTDHDTLDYGKIASCARLIVDTRNVFGRMGLANTHVVKA